MPQHEDDRFAHVMPIRMMNPLPPEEVLEMLGSTLGGTDYLSGDGRMYKLIYGLSFTKKEGKPVLWVGLWKNHGPDDIPKDIFTAIIEGDLSAEQVAKLPEVLAPVKACSLSLSGLITQTAELLFSEIVKAES